MDDTEIWKAVPGYEGLYEVSDLGRVRSVDRFYECASRWGGTGRPPSAISHCLVGKKKTAYGRAWRLA